jgi:hypothetical protein
VGRLKLGLQRAAAALLPNHTSSPNRLWRSCEWQQVPVSGGELLRFRFARRGEESGKSCLLLLLMGINPAKPFKEKPFMPAPLLSGGPTTVLRLVGVLVAVLSTESECRIFKALHDSVDAQMDCLLAEDGVAVLNLLATKPVHFELD